jgi:hypothetical protein
MPHPYGESTLSPLQPLAGFLARMVRDYEANEDAFNEALQAQYALKTTELPWA